MSKISFFVFFVKASLRESSQLWSFDDLMGTLNVNKKLSVRIAAGEEIDYVDKGRGKKKNKLGLSCAKLSTAWASYPLAKQLELGTH